MDFNLNDDQRMIVDTAEKIGKKFGPDYWLEQDNKHEFPREFLMELGESGFLGLGVPEEYGGYGMGLTEGVLILEALSRAGGGGGPLLCYLFGVLGGLAVVSHGNEEQKEKYLPKIVTGEVSTALGLTEPDAGTNSLNIRTFAKKDGDYYIINGAKIFISMIEDAQAILLVARTSKPEESSSKAKGMSLFLVDLPDSAIQYTKIAKHGMNYYATYELGIDDLKVPASCLLGEEGKGWFQLLSSLNPERVLEAAGAVGLGRIAIEHAVKYANERAPFDRPIGAYQGIQFPLAAAYAKLECSWLATLKAAAMYDQNASAKHIGDVSNMAKYAAVEASIEAVYHAMQTLGGYGYACEYHIERWWREVQLMRLAPVTQQMTLNYLGEHVLGLPRSY